MKKILILAVLVIISCGQKKTEFVQSKVRTNLFLIKNPPENDSLLKKEIISFLIKNPPKDDFSDLFYKYTSDTEYFLENEDYDGFGAQVLSMYHDLYLASFAFNKCKNDTTKLVGRFHFYGNKSNLSQLDTIIYKCN